MPGLDPGIHAPGAEKAGITGSRPVMTGEVSGQHPQPLVMPGLDPGIYAPMLRKGGDHRGEPGDDEGGRRAGRDTDDTKSGVPRDPDDTEGA
jgi:hypothetical protein